MFNGKVLYTLELKSVGTNSISFERTKEVIGNRYIVWTNRSTGREDLLRDEKQILETLVYYQEVTKDENGDLIYSSTQPAKWV